MKTLAILFLAVSAHAALADSSRNISTKDLICYGKNTEGAQILMLVKADNDSTQLQIVDQSNDLYKISNPSTLAVQSEGNTYVQQVSNEQGYNLLLSGEGLEEVLAGTCKIVDLKGSLNVFKGSSPYDLVCQGTLY
jgi:hypothetical protein